MPKHSGVKVRNLTAKDLGIEVPTEEELRSVRLPMVTPAELNFILAGLRLLQKEGLCVPESYPAKHREIVEIIMVPDPDHDEWLEAEQIDELCARIYLDSEGPKPRKPKEKGKHGKPS